MNKNGFSTILFNGQLYIFLYYYTLKSIKHNTFTDRHGTFPIGVHSTNNPERQNNSNQALPDPREVSNIYLFEVIKVNCI